MIDQYTVLFYDGNRSLPRKARIELSDQNIYLFDEDGTNIDNGVAYPLNNCSYSYLENRLFVYLEKSAHPYFVIDQTNPFYEELSNQLTNQKKVGWYEKLLQQKWLSLCIILILLISIFYFILTEILPITTVRFISSNQESTIGEKIYQSIITESKIDSAATIQAQHFADQLKLSNKYKISVTVLKEDEINAYALPGGHILINSGILKIMDHPEELVALLGHESTHINRRHSLKGLISNMGLSLFQAIAFSGMGGVGDLILKNASTLRQLSYSRSLEREADLEGMNLMLENKVDPAGMKMLLSHLQKSIKTSIPNFSFISTHPLTQERIDDANKLLLKHINATTQKQPELDIIWGLLKKESKEAH